MLPRLVPEILPLYAFCDVIGVGVAGVVVGVVVAGVGDSRSWISHPIGFSQDNGQGGRVLWVQSFQA